MKKCKVFNSAGVALLVLPIAVSLAYAPIVSAQPYHPPESSVQAQVTFAQQDLDQMLAPIALYPDSLLSQILMAATYPREVEQAARWSRANPGIHGDQAVQAVAREDWDPSVKSLVAFPQILAMMDAKPDWTERLGDAFLAQEPQVMDSVQNLRQRAYAAGNFRSDDQIRVVPQGGAIVVESMNPEIVYVPYYDPMVVYGGWWWPSPPVYWSPWYGYHAPHPGFYLSWGSGIRVASGFFFGAFDWPRRYTRVAHVNNYYYNRTADVYRQGRDNAFARNTYAAPGAWQHNPTHRRGAQYRDPGVRARFAAENSPTTQTTTRTARPPETRTLDSGRNVAGEPRMRIDEGNSVDNRRAIRQPTEYRSDERRRPEAVTRIETPTESRVDVGRPNSGRVENSFGNRVESQREVRREVRTIDRREAPAQAERVRAPEVRREAPPASRSQAPAPQARVEQQQVRRPVAAPDTPPRAESVARAAPLPQPRVEAPRSAMPSQAAASKRDQESRAPGNGGRRQAREGG